ncbi:MAG: multicopper oxidase domain-containing protein [Bryobacteraceae bacterium]
MDRTRRDFIHGTLGTGAALLASRQSGSAQAPTAATHVKLAGTAATGTLDQPEERRSVNGLLDTQLRVQYSHHYIGDDLVYLRTYEGSLVGPTLRVRPGDMMKVRLLNCLPADLMVQHTPDMNRPHGINVTNLHVHGLHISPSGNSDNVFLEIGSGGEFPFEFRIEDDHPAGTYWYHAHKHGSSGVQLGNGMAGAIIIEGNLDAFLDSKGFGDRTLVLQQIPYSFKYDKDKKQNIPATVEWPNVFHERFSKYTLINGRLKPSIVIDGRAERWRFVHAGVSEMEDIALLDSQGKKVPLHRIAVDGITTGKVEPFEEIEMGPGYRVDVLVKLPPGKYKLMKTAQSAITSLRGVPEEAQELADVEVRGDSSQELPTNQEMSSYAPSFPDISEITGEKRKVIFTASPTWPSINGAKFQPDPTLPGHINHRMKLNTTDEWLLGNETFAARGRRFAHPFHIHINPFKVTSILNEKNQEVDAHDLVWRDTILVRPNYKITIRAHYLKFTGRAVLHCHILPHEDEGMMQVIDIRP